MFGANIVGRKARSSDVLFYALCSMKRHINGGGAWLQFSWKERIRDSPAIADLRYSERLDTPILFFGAEEVEG